MFISAHSFYNIDQSFDSGLTVEEMTIDAKYKVDIRGWIISTGSVTIDILDEDPAETFGIESFSGSKIIAIAEESSITLNTANGIRMASDVILAGDKSTFTANAGTLFVMGIWDPTTEKPYRTQRAGFITSPAGDTTISINAPERIIINGDIYAGTYNDLTDTDGDSIRKSGLNSSVIFNDAGQDAPVYILGSINVSGDLELNAGFNDGNDESLVISGIITSLGDGKTVNLVAPESIYITNKIIVKGESSALNIDAELKAFISGSIIGSDSISIQAHGKVTPQLEIAEEDYAIIIDPRSFIRTTEASSSISIFSEYNLDIDGGIFAGYNPEDPDIESINKDDFKADSDITLQSTRQIMLNAALYAGRQITLESGDLAENTFADITVTTQAAMFAFGYQVNPENEIDLVTLTTPGEILFRGNIIAGGFFRYVEVTDPDPVSYKDGIDWVDTPELIASDLGVRMDSEELEIDGFIYARDYIQTKSETIKIKGVSRLLTHAEDSTITITTLGKTDVLGFYLCRW